MRIVRHILIAFFLLFSNQAIAHAPYEHNVGSFVRADGTAISVVQHFEDGLIFNDFMTVHFRFVDGKTFAKAGPYKVDVLVRTTASAAEIYTFESRWVPIADSIKQYDGYTFREITQTKQNVSLFLHTAHNWKSYAFELGVVVVLLLIWFVLNFVPHKGYLKFLRISAFVGISLLGAMWCIVILFIASGSPLILSVLAFLFAAVYMLIHKMYRHACAA